MTELESRLGYRFRDRRLLDTALTHSSYANENKGESNERLEFLGDSVLGMLAARRLFTEYPDMPEGKMTRLRSELVCERSLYTAASELGVGACLRLGRGEESTGGRERPSILADAMEAVIAAMYIDGGEETACAFVDKHILRLTGREAERRVVDYKTTLQELVQREAGARVAYTLVSEEGPDHDKLFTAEVTVNGEAAGIGTGRSKKEAEQSAAKSALEALSR